MKYDTFNQYWQTIGCDFAVSKESLWQAAEHAFNAAKEQGPNIMLDKKFWEERNKIVEVPKI